jgi:GNAT superfamily N-acetyltransferase
VSRARTIGRVDVFHHVSDPLPDEPPLDRPGHRLVTERDPAGSTTLRVLDGAGAIVASLVIHAAIHGDAFYGRWSRPDERYCYASALFVDPDARGGGLGRYLMLAGRHVSAGEGGRGVKHFIACDNEPSLRANRAAGYVITDELHGVRIGPRILWWSTRRVDR